jgi:hypothetical protein
MDDMLQVVAFFGILIILACARGLADPQDLLRQIDRFSGVGGYVAAIIMRFALGIAALLAADASRLSPFLQVIGGLSLLAALVLLVMGRVRFVGLIGWVAGFSPSWLRIWLLFGMVFGVALVWVTGIV